MSGLIQICSHMELSDYNMPDDEIMRYAFTRFEHPVPFQGRLVKFRDLSGDEQQALVHFINSNDPSKKPVEFVKSQNHQHGSL